jgi:hypothetical protein
MDLIKDFTIDIVDLNASKPEFKKRIIQGSVEL